MMPGIGNPGRYYDALNAATDNRSVHGGVLPNVQQGSSVTYMCCPRLSLRPGAGPLFLHVPIPPFYVSLSDQLVLAYDHSTYGGLGWLGLSEPAWARARCIQYSSVWAPPLPRRFVLSIFILIQQCMYEFAPIKNFKIAGPPQTDQSHRHSQFPIYRKNKAAF
jgi:hypothetical protein